MDEDRFVISNELWEKIAPMLPGKAGDPGATGHDNRLFMEAVCWRVRTGVPWRDLPKAFGKWNTVFRRFRRWAKAGVFERLFNAINGEPDLECAMIDGTIVQAHQKASGAKGRTQHQAIGRSRGGLSTKIVGMVDALGNLFRFLLLPGQAHDMKGVAPLIRDVPFGALLADKAFDVDWLLQELDERGAIAVIPPKANRKMQRDYDTHMYKWRHLVENYFAKIKDPHCPSNLPILTSNLKKNHVKSMYCLDIERSLLFTQWVQVWVGVIGGERFPIIASNIFKNMQLSIILSPFVASVNIEKYFQ